jgi:hypothetical protein
VLRDVIILPCTVYSRHTTHDTRHTTHDTRHTRHTTHTAHDTRERTACAER